MYKSTQSFQKSCEKMYLPPIAGIMFEKASLQKNIQLSKLLVDVFIIFQNWYNLLKQEHFPAKIGKVYYINKHIFLLIGNNRSVKTHCVYIHKYNL